MKIGPLISAFVLIFATPLYAALSSSVERAARLDEVSRNKSGYYFACDERQSPKRKEIAEALDQNATALLRLMETEPPEGFRLVNVGLTQLRERIAPTKSLGRIENFISWDKLYVKFLELKDKPINQNWLTFSREAYSLLRLDSDRKIYHTRASYFGIEKDYEQAIEQIQACLAQPGCVDLPQDHKLKRLMTRSYALDLFESRRLVGATAKREFLNEFLVSLKKDYAGDFIFAENNGIERSSAGEIILSLDPGPFRGFEAVLAKSIESFWQSPALKIRVRWTSQKVELRAHRLIFEPSLNFGAFTSATKRTIRLAHSLRTTTLAHEVGHALGFPDRYYIRWDDKNCHYIDQYNDDDIMSDSENGTIRAEDWNELDRMYPYKPAG